MQRRRIIRCQFHGGQQVLAKLRFAHFDLRCDLLFGRPRQQLPQACRPNHNQHGDVHAEAEPPASFIAEQPVPVHGRNNGNTDQECYKPRADSSSHDQPHAATSKLLQFGGDDGIQSDAHCDLSSAGQRDVVQRVSGVSKSNLHSTYNNPARFLRIHSIVSSKTIAPNHQ